MASKKKESNTVAFIIAAVILLVIYYGSHSSHSQPRVTSNNNEILAKRLAREEYHWIGTQWIDLDYLWTRESGFRIVWNYQGSGAYGIPQALPADKMAVEGPGWQTSAYKQIQWGLHYIRHRYRNPANAWAHETTYGWY